MVIAQPLPPFLPQSQEQGHRALLSAIAAFFDRFAGSGLMGTLCFSMGPAPWQSVWGNLLGYFRC